MALLVESSRASGRALLCGIARCAHHYGPWSFYWEPGGLEKAWPKLKALDVDGIILRDVDKLEEVPALGIPAVVIGHSKTEIPNMVNVVTDSSAIGQIGAEHLLQCGFKHFAYCGYTGAPWSDLRLKFFGRRIRQAGFRLHVYADLVPAANAWHKQLHKMAAWLLTLPKPVGLMACNDDCGRQVIEAGKLANLAVPDAVGSWGPTTMRWSADSQTRPCRAWPSTLNAPVMRRRWCCSGCCAGPGGFPQKLPCPQPTSSPAVPRILWPYRIRM